MSWYTVTPVSDRVFCINEQGQCHFYLIHGSEKSLLVDTGWGVGDLPNLVASLSDRPLEVVCTHGHPDHMGGAYQFPLVYLKEDDLSILQWEFGRRLKDWALTHALKPPYPSFFDPQRWLDGHIDQLIPIQDGHVFDLGDRRLEVIGLPGHTPGSIGLFDQDNGLFFSGDTIVQGDIWMHLEHSTPLYRLLESLKKVQGLDVRQILPAHGVTPLGNQITSDLIHGIESILRQERTGVLHRTVAGEGLLSRFGSCGVITRLEGPPH